MTWPSGDEPTTALDQGTDTPPRAVFLSLVQKFNLMRAHVSTYMQDVMTSADAAAARVALGFSSTRLVVPGAYTPPIQPAHSATPTFNCGTSNVFEPAALTGNVTSMTMSNQVGGQTVNIRFVQDATGGRTVAVPAGAKISGTANTGANRVSWLVMTYSARASRWEGVWSEVPA